VLLEGEFEVAAYHTLKIMKVLKVQINKVCFRFFFCVWLRFLTAVVASQHFVPSAFETAVTTAPALVTTQRTLRSRTKIEADAARAAPAPAPTAPAAAAASGAGALPQKLEAKRSKSCPLP
jgi:hypothetical protein